MKYRTLGKTGLKVSEVGFGAWAIGGNDHGNSYGPTDDKVSLEAVERAFELGCNFYDTADVYGHGHSEELLGQALRDHRKEVILATKVGGDFYHDPPRMNFNPDYLEFALAKSCERLQTHYIDLYQLHNPPHPITEEWKDLRRSREAEGFWTNPTLRGLDPRSARGTLVDEIRKTCSGPSRFQLTTPGGQEPAFPGGSGTECGDNRARTTFQRIPNRKIQHRLNLSLRGYSQ